MRALILSGGGANGAWQAGRLTRLQPTCDIVVGCSVGALNGIMIATDQLSLLKYIWIQLNEKQVLKRRSNARVGWNFLRHKIGIATPYLGAWKNDPLRKLIEKYVLGKESKINYYCSVVQIGDDSPNAYYKHYIPAGKVITDMDVSFILASTTIPGVFEPVEINGSLYVDGGVYHQSPVTETIRKNPVNEILAITCNPIRDTKATQPKDLQDMAGWILDALLKSSFNRDWKHMMQVNDIVKACGNIEIDGHIIRYIENEIHQPPGSLGNSLDFSHQKNVRLYEQGYQSPY